MGQQRMTIETVITMGATWAAIAAPWGARSLLAGLDIQPPGLDLGTATSSAILGWLVWHVMHRVMPRLMDELRAESQANREHTAAMAASFAMQMDAEREERARLYQEFVRRGEEGHPGKGPAPRGPRG